MSVKINGTTGIEAPGVVSTSPVTFSGITNTGTYNGGQLTNRNMIINGDMRIAQRSTSVTNTANNGFNTVDRFNTYLGTASKVTFDVTQSTDAPHDFMYSNKIAVNTITDNNTPVTMGYGIEGIDMHRLAFGTSSAKNSTVSFWVKSNIVGTYAIEVKAYNGANYYTTVLNYDIVASGVWEYKTIAVPPLTNFLPAYDNTKGLAVEFWLSDSNGTYSGSTATQGAWVGNGSISNSMRAAGQTANLVSSASGYWQITGLQYELGDATPFEHRPYVQELALCQRYYEVISRYCGASSYGTIWSQPLEAFSNCWTPVRYAVVKRAAPSFGLVSGTSWSGTTPNVYLNSQEAAVFQASGYFYQTGGGGNPGSPMAYVDAEI